MTISASGIVDSPWSATTGLGAFRKLQRALRTENTQMLDAAHAAAFHWSKVGTGINAARADMSLAHVHALLGHAELALQHANACFTKVTSRESPEWELAFAHAVLARAASVAGNAELHSRHFTLAKQLGQALPDAEDREIFEATFCRVPVPA
jgi:hypothetical protein